MAWTTCGAVAAQSASIAQERQQEQQTTLEREEERQRVRNKIARLQQGYRELLLLKVQEGKTYREIAEITGLSVTNVGYRLHHAMKALAVRFKEDGQHESPRHGELQREGLQERGAS